MTLITLQTKLHLPCSCETDHTRLILTMVVMSMMVVMTMRMTTKMVCAVPRLFLQGPPKHFFWLWAVLAINQSWTNLKWLLISITMMRMMMNIVRSFLIGAISPKRMIKMMKRRRFFLIDWNYTGGMLVTNQSSHMMMMMNSVVV